MKKARIAELKNRLSYYLRFVRRGQPVVVYDRDRPIARIDPIGGPGAAGAGEALGHLRPPSAPLPRGWLQARRLSPANLVDALLAERREGR
jgi:prevent-host-death family protein